MKEKYYDEEANKICDSCHDEEQPAIFRYDIKIKNNPYYFLICPECNIADKVVPVYQRILKEIRNGR